MSKVLLQVEDTILTDLAKVIMIKTERTDPLAFSQFATAVNVIVTDSSGYKYHKLLYELPEPMAFNGIDDYIDTGITLLDTDEDFTILIDAINGEGNDTLSTILHCMSETYPYPGISMAVSNYSSHSNEYAATFYSRVSFIPVSPNLSSFRAALRREKNGYMSVTAYSNGNYLSISSISGNESWSSIPQTLLIGCYQASDGKKGRFWNGVINDLKVFNRYMGASEVTNYLENGAL